jgi:hypothetical protein
MYLLEKEKQEKFSEKKQMKILKYNCSRNVVISDDNKYLAVSQYWSGIFR